MFPQSIPNTAFGLNTVYSPFWVLKFWNVFYFT